MMKFINQRESEEIKVELCRKNVRKGTAETEDKDMGMFSRKDLIRLFAPLLVEQLLAVLWAWQMW